jgi:ankyrin repeat protein
MATQELNEIIDFCKKGIIEDEFPVSNPLRKERIAEAYERKFKRAFDLIATGIDPHARNSVGYSLLCSAITKITEPIALAMISAGMDPNIRDFGEYTPLMIAVKSDLYLVVDLLLAKGADINAINYMGHSPLLIACNYGSVEMAKHLVEMGANTQIKDLAGNTACWTCTRKPTFKPILEDIVCRKRGGFHSRRKTVRCPRLNKRRQQSRRRR